MHPFHDYLTQQLAEKLSKRRVVIWYVPRAEFRPFLRELRGGDSLGCMLESTKIGDIDAHVCVYQGSLFEVKFTAEPVVSAEAPDPLLIYIATDKPDCLLSPLAELEWAGETYEPQLKRLARNVLRHQYSDGQIDELLAADSVAYADIVRLLTADSGSQKSMLNVIFEKANNNAALLADWLATPGLPRHHDRRKGGTRRVEQADQLAVGTGIGRQRRLGRCPFESAALRAGGRVPRRLRR